VGVYLSAGSVHCSASDQYQQLIGRYMTSSANHVTGWTDNNRKLIGVLRPFVKLRKSRYRHGALYKNIYS